MKVHRAGLAHELLILVLYIVGSPLVFGVVYPERITGDSGILYVGVLIIAILTAIISLITIWIIKRQPRESRVELLLGLVPFSLSTALYGSLWADSSTIVRNTCFLANSLELIVLYGCSIAYKLLWCNFDAQ